LVRCDHRRPLAFAPALLAYPHRDAACDRRPKNNRDRRIDLLFAHPLSIESEQLGFPRTDHVGYTGYKSAEVPPCRLDWPRAAATGGARFPCNLYEGVRSQATVEPRHTPARPRAATAESAARPATTSTPVEVRRAQPTREPTWNPQTRKLMDK